MRRKQQSEPARQHQGVIDASVDSPVQFAVNGNRRHVAVADCWRHQADAITLDLAQGVAGERKSEARALLSDGIPLAARGGAEVFVRVNRAFAYADIEAAAGPRAARGRAARGGIRRRDK